MYYFISIIISVIVVFGGCFSQKKKNVTLHGYGSDAGEHGAFGLTEAAYCSDSNALNYSSVAPNNDILEISCAYQFTYCRAVVEYFTTFNGSPWTSEMDMMCHNTIENGMRVSRCNTGGNGLFDGNFPFEPFSTDHWLSIVESESAFLAKFPIEYTTIQGDQIRVTGDRDLVTCRNFSNMYNDKPLFEGPKPYEECTSCTPDPSIEIVTKISGPIKSTKEIATCSVSGASTINPLSGEFQESVLIVGTGLNLQYSTRKIKSKNGDLFEIPISIVPDESYTNTLEHVKIELEVAGRKLKVPSEFQPDSEGYRVSIYWDGKDLFRRVVPGEVKAKLRMRFGFIPN